MCFTQAREMFNKSKLITEAENILCDAASLPVIQRALRRTWINNAG